MKSCPKCAGELAVKDSRPVDDGIRRRRVCLSCGHRLTTFEIPQSEMEKVRRVTALIRQLEALA